MRTGRTTAGWMGLAFAGAAAVATIVLAVFGANERGTDIALQMTARLSFLLFWPAYAGGGLVALFGPAFQPVKQHGREFGLAFAAAHLVHVGLIVWLCRIGAAPATGVFLFFGPALAFTYLLAVSSVRGVRNMLGRAGWWVLRAVGMNTIAYAFAADFLRYPSHGWVRYAVAYLPFAVLSVVGPVLYVAGLVPQERLGLRPRPRWGREAPDPRT